jgi:transposase
LSQPTQDQCVQFQIESDASRLFALEGFAVARIVTDGEEGRVVHVVTADETAAGCPSCGVISVSVKARVSSRPRDLLHGPVGLSVVWHKRRWRCIETACKRRSFTESLPAIPARARLTTRLRTELGSAVADSGRTVAEVAGHHRVGWPTVHRAFIDHVTPALAAPLPPVTVLGIDETRRGKPKWIKDQGNDRWILATDRWHTGLVDAEGTGGLLGQVEGRSAAAVVGWLQAQPQTWRKAITHVTIDLSASYAAAVSRALPNAVLVADRFHLVQLANNAVTAVRQRVIRETEGRRGRTIDPAWRVRRRLLTGYERLRPDTFTRMWNTLIDTGDPGAEILSAWVVKEDLRALLALAGTNPTRPEIRARLETFYGHAAASTAPEAHRLAATVEAWWPAIEAGLRTGYSNARSEGYNRLAKHEGRNAFGFRNPTNQRRRIRWACTRQHRRAAAVMITLPA